MILLTVLIGVALALFGVILWAIGTFFLIVVGKELVWVDRAGAALVFTGIVVVLWAILFQLLILIGGKL